MPNVFCIYAAICVEVVPFIVKKGNQTYIWKANFIFCSRLDIKTVEIVCRKSSSPMRLSLRSRFANTKNRSLIMPGRFVYSVKVTLSIDLPGKQPLVGAVERKAKSEKTPKRYGLSSSLRNSSSNSA